MARPHPPPHERGLALVTHDEDVDLRKIWQTARRYRWTILSVAGLAFATALVVSVVMRPVYRGTALVEIRPASSSLIRLDAVQSALDGSADHHLETQWRILESEAVAEAVIDRLGLHDHPELVEPSERDDPGGALAGFAGLFERSSGTDPDREREWLRTQRFLERVTVEPVHDSNLVAVSFDSFDPELAARAANAIVEEYVRLNDRRRLRTATGAQSFLSEEIARAEERLEKSERALNRFARENNVYDVDERTGLVSERVSDLSAELTRAVAERVEAEALYRRFVASPGSVLPSSRDNEAILSLKERRAQLLAEHERLSGIYKESYPRLVQLRAEIAEVEAGLRDEIQEIRELHRSSYEKSLEKEKLLSAELDSGKSAMLDLKDRAVQYHILKRDWETNRELHAGLLEQMKELGVTVDMQLDNVSLIDVAKPPVRAARPRPLLYCAMATTSGLVLGLALALVLGTLDDRVRTADDLEFATGLTNLGLLPKVANPLLDAGETAQAAFRSRPQMALAEALRSLRTNLLGSRENSARRILQVTSADVGEGKTTTASNLALVLAEQGSRVLLVDADLRRPQIHRHFHLDRGPGLSELVTEGDPSGLRESEIPNLWILPAGRGAANPPNVLNMVDVQVLAEAIPGGFDHVIVDSPPLLGLADSVVVGTKVDGVVVVASAEAARRKITRDAVRRLRLVGAPLVGTVLNKIDVKRDEEGHYGRYYYSYSSRERSPSATGAVS